VVLAVVELGLAGDMGLKGVEFRREAPGSEKVQGFEEEIPREAAGA